MAISMDVFSICSWQFLADFIVIYLVETHDFPHRSLDILRLRLKYSRPARMAGASMVKAVAA